MQNIKRALWLIFAPVFVTLLVACQPAEEEPQSLEDRAQARWDLMVARDFDNAWEYYTPGFRERTGVADFARDMKRRPVHWLEAEVVGANCDAEDHCKVKVEVLYRVPQAPDAQKSMKLTRQIEDEWIRLDGQWWFVKN